MLFLLNYLLLFFISAGSFDSTITSTTPDTIVDMNISPLAQDTTNRNNTREKPFFNNECGIMNLQMLFLLYIPLVLFLSLIIYFLTFDIFRHDPYALKVIVYTSLFAVFLVYYSVYFVAGMLTKKYCSKKTYDMIFI